MRLFLSLATGTMSIWLLLAGCSSGNATVGAGTTGTGGSGAGSTGAAGIGGASAAVIQTYCDTTADAFCEAYFACCKIPDPWSGGTLENCKQRFGYGGSKCLWGDAQRYEASIEAGITVFNHAELDACVAPLKSMSAGGTACVEPSIPFLWGVCPNAFQGQLATGEPCTGIANSLTSAVECKHGACDKTTHTCIAAPQLGEPCGISSATCEWGQGNICVSSGICIHRGDIGAPCVQNPECKSFNCDLTSGTCVLPDAYGLCVGG